MACLIERLVVSGPGVKRIRSLAVGTGVALSMVGRSP
jgi:hypothetical protein